MACNIHPKPYTTEAMLLTLDKVLHKNFSGVNLAFRPASGASTFI